MSSPPGHRHSLPALVTAAALCLGSFAVAAEATAAQQATLVLRILAFDRTLAARASGVVTIAVVYKEGNPHSETALSQVAGALEKAARSSSVAGLPVRVERLAWGTNFEGELQRQGAAAVYLCPGLDEAMGAVSRATQARRVLTFSASEDYLKAGASIALVRRETKLGVVVHLANARREGADLDSNLLRIVEVIR
ncbi:MAG: YfiR family protein [Myxococcaceae bacterium]